MSNLIKMTRGLILRTSSNFRSGREPKPLINTPELNIFQCLPPEIFHELLGYLSFRDLGQLALTCDPIRALVADWLTTRRASNRIPAQLTPVIPVVTGASPKDAAFAALAAPGQVGNFDFPKTIYYLKFSF